MSESVFFGLGSRKTYDSRITLYYSIFSDGGRGGGVFRVTEVFAEPYKDVQLP